VLEKLPEQVHPDLILGCRQADDSGVVRVSEDKAIILTVDFFPAILDDPYDFGQVAAANALSDVYAMGGNPLCALNITAFNIDQTPLEVLADILRGGADKVNQAGAVIVGGHTLKGSELKYGLSVTGTIHPDSIVTTAGARPGDSLVLTKPLGTGIYSTALKTGELDSRGERLMTAVMAALNRDASELMIKHRACACTDVTGFGLTGHALEMAEASGVSLALNFDSIPLLPNASRYAERGFLTGGGLTNHDCVKGKITFEREITEAEKMIICDPQTSGGLLIALPGAEAKAYSAEMAQRGHEDTAVIGEVIASDSPAIIIT